MNELKTITEKEQVPAEIADELYKSFEPFFAKAQEWKDKATELVVTSEDQTDLMKQAREARLVLKNIRVDANKTRETLKQDIVRKGKAIDGMFNVIKYLIEPIEKHLETQEKFKELQEEKRRAEKLEKRKSELEKYEIATELYNLEAMTDEQFDELLQQQKAVYEKRLEDERKAEQERIEREQKERLHNERKNEILDLWQFLGNDQKNLDFSDMKEAQWAAFKHNLQLEKDKLEKEQERIRKENEKLKAEREQAEKIKKERIEMLNGLWPFLPSGVEYLELSEKDFQDFVSKGRRAKSDHEQKEQAERERKNKIFKERRDKLIQIGFQAGKEHVMKLEGRSELTPEQVIDMDQSVFIQFCSDSEKWIKEQEEQKRKEQAEKAPDKEKLKALAATLSSIDLPKVDNKEAKEAVNKVSNQLAALASELKLKASEL